MSGDLFETFLAEERLRNARQIAGLRLLGAAGIALLGLAFAYFFPGFIGAPTWLMVPYLCIAALVYRRQRRAASVPWWDGLAIPLVDVPVVFALFQGSIEQLHQSGAHGDAAKLPTAAAVFFALMVLFAALSLSRWQVLLTTGTALVAQSLLIHSEGPGEYYMISQAAVSIALGAGLALYSCDRTTRLMRGFAEAQLRQERLGRYFSPQIAAHLHRLDDSHSEGESVEVTLMFIDLRGFTELADGMDSRAVVELLNQFHTRMVDCLFRFGGTLDKYLGDGLMAYFGAPLQQPDHATQAVACALEMQVELTRMNAQRSPATPLAMGIGLHTGQVVIGDIGAPQRREFTAIGDAVNVASRIEQLTKLHSQPILLSEDTRRRIGEGEFEFAAVEAVIVKGKREPLPTYVPRRTLPPSDDFARLAAR